VAKLTKKKFPDEWDIKNPFHMGDPDEGPQTFRYQERKA
jgi:hypothetical protein